MDYIKEIKPLLIAHKVWVVIVVVVVLILGAWFVVYSEYFRQIRPLSENTQMQRVEIAEGSSVGDVGQLLEDEKIIRSASAFRVYVRLKHSGVAFQAGMFEVSPSMDLDEIIKILSEGKPVMNLVTILPGRRIDQVKKTLIEQGFSESSVDAALDPSNYRNHPALIHKPASASLEGYLFPESFLSRQIDTPADVIRLSLDQMALVLTSEVVNGIKNQGLTVHEGIIMASVIELEIGDENPDQDLEDKRKVAQVFYRRLKEDIALQSNPTTLYGAVIEGVVDEYLSQSGDASFTFDTPYNTYLYKGLPPSPISNVGGNSLKAVADPAPTNYLFFFSGDDKKNYFSENLQTHENLMRQYCRVRCQGFY
jgi:UPF0755 protein